MTMFFLPIMVKIAIAICVIFGAYKGSSLIIDMAPPGLGFFVQPHEMEKVIPETGSNGIPSLLGDMIEISKRTSVVDALTLVKDLLPQRLTTLFGVLTQIPDFQISSYFNNNKVLIYSLICFIILCLIHFLFSLMNMLKIEQKRPDKKEMLKLETQSHVKQESEKNNMILSGVDIDIYDSIAQNKDLILTREPLIEVSLPISEQLPDTEKTSSLKNAVIKTDCLPENDNNSRHSSECQQENESEEGIPVSGEIVSSDMVEQIDEIKDDHELTNDNNDDDDDEDNDQVMETRMTPDLKSVDDDDDDDDVIIRVVDLPDVLSLSHSDYESMGILFAFSASEMARRLIKGEFDWNEKRLYKENSVILHVCNDSQTVLLKGPKDDVELAYDSLRITLTW